MSTSRRHYSIILAASLLVPWFGSCTPGSGTAGQEEGSQGQATQGQTVQRETEPAEPLAGIEALGDFPGFTGWAEVLKQARGDTVRWYL